jgi:UDPglucose 6-dehydrogenase
MSLKEVGMKNICIIGAGHVGLVTGTCLAELGNKVNCMDDDSYKIKSLVSGIIPFYEPGLEELVHRNTKSGRLFFTTSMEEGIGQGDIVFICVGTPQKRGGEADSSYIETAIKRIAEVIDSYKVIVEKSTVPVKTADWIKRAMKLSKPNDCDFDIVCNPEFMREGQSIHDFMHPDRIVLGVENKRAADIMVEVYKPLNAPVILTNLETAEIIKHACNAFLALKISYINLISNVCENVGADVVKVAEAMAYDPRIGKAFLNAGVGYGGYCLPKDLAAFAKLMDEHGCDSRLLKSIRKINDSQRKLIVKKAKDALWNLDNKTIGILGLSYKPDTDDLREAPAIDIIGQLKAQGARIRAYDPQAMESARAILKDLEYCQGPYEVAEGSDALVILTEWDEFRNLDLSKIKKLLKQPVIIDGRNIFDPYEMKKSGFIYRGIGR